MKQELESKTRRSVLQKCKTGLYLRGHKSGQAVVEYILIVSIAIAFIFILKGAFSSMSQWIDNYLGSYTECLMAHGELPVLGVGNATFNDSSTLKEHLSSGYTCNSGFKPFTLAEGRPPIANGSVSNNASKNSSGKGSTNSNSSSTSGDSGSDKKSSKDKDGDSDLARKGGGGGGSGGSDGEDGKPRRAGRGTADGIASASSNQRLIDDEEGDELGGRGRKRKPRESRIIYRDRPRYKAILGDEAEQLVKNTQRSTNKRKVTSRSIARVEAGGLTGPRSGLMKQPPKKEVTLEEKREEAWGFGKLFKWLLIICIIIALVIFFGGQLLNYSNSDS